MNESPQFEEIFQDALGRIEGGESVQECLASHPELTSEMVSALEVVGALRRLITSLPARSDETRTIAKEQFLAALARQQVALAPAPTSADPTPPPTPKVSQPTGYTTFGERWRDLLSTLRQGLVVQRLAPALGMLVLVILLVSGTVIASAASLPGDALYPVKLAAEQVQKVVVIGKEQQTRLEQIFEQRRMAEINAVLKTRREVQVSFSGIIQDVRPGALVVNGLVVRLDEGSQVEGAPAIGEMAAITVQTRQTGDLVAVTVRVSIAPPPTATPRPTLKRPVATRRLSAPPTAIAPVKTTSATSTRADLTTPTVLATEDTLLTPTAVATAGTETPLATAASSPTAEITPQGTATVLPTPEGTPTPLSGSTLTPAPSPQPSPVNTAAPTLEVTVGPTGETTPSAPRSSATPTVPVVASTLQPTPAETALAVTTATPGSQPVATDTPVLEAPTAVPVPPTDVPAPTELPPPTAAPVPTEPPPPPPTAVPVPPPPTAVPAPPESPPPTAAP